MAKTNKFFDVQNVLISLKAIGSSIVTGLVLLVPMAISRLLLKDGNWGISAIIGFASLVIYLFAWGFFSKLFWKWK